jgi:riboflavin synthase
MFSGMVETIGIITDLIHQNGCKHFTITPTQRFDDLTVGDSIAVNGACLTVTQFTPHSFNVTAVPETLRITNLDKLYMQNPVNLERSLKASSRIDGHNVQGHVEAMGQILAITPDHSDAWLVKISLPHQLAKYVVPKGYITLDGMSITVIEATPEWFTVTFIPHTQAVTITKHYTPGAWINIEVDILGKYIEKLLGAYTHANLT